MLVIRHPEQTGSIMPGTDSKMPSFLDKLARKISTRQNIHTHTDTDTVGSGEEEATRLSVDLDPVMPQGDNCFSTVATSTNSEQSKVIRMGIDLARKLFHSSRDERTDSFCRIDPIYDVHEHTLHRRRTTEDLQRPMKPSISKLDISKPITSPPAPEETLLHRYEQRQTAWKKRSMSFKIKRLDSVKRWSWTPWKSQSGQENIPNATSLESSNTGETKKLVPRDPIREAEDFHDKAGSFARERARRINELRAAGLEISIKPAPNGAATLRGQRRNPLNSPTDLDAIDEQPSQLSHIHPIHCHSVSASRIPRPRNLSHQPLMKSASTGMLRPGQAHDSHLDIPSLPQTSSAKGRRHIHPSLRAQHSAPLRANDQRHIHPALDTQPCPSLSATGQRHNRPALHSELAPRQVTTDQPHVHPAFRKQPSITSMTSLNKINTTESATPTVRTVPRFRIIPPTPLIGPDGIPTVYAERAFIASNPPTKDEQRLLVQTLNTSRATVSAAPLELEPELNNRAQQYVNLEIPPLPPAKPTPIPFRRHASLHLREARQRPTTIEDIPFAESCGSSAVRLISPTGLGVLACAELWAGGKYKRHKTVRTSHPPGQHRYTFLPDCAMEADVESMTSMASHGHGHGHSRSHSESSTHSSWCVCAEYDAWEMVTDKRYKKIGVGCAEDGRWVVELWEPAAASAACTL